MKTLITMLAVVGIVLALAPATQADLYPNANYRFNGTVTTSPGVYDWHDAANWGENVPAVGWTNPAPDGWYGENQSHPLENGGFDDGGTVVVSQNVIMTDGPHWMNLYGNGTMTIQINDGVTMNSTDKIRFNNIAIDLPGGTISMGDTAYNGWDNSPTMTISGDGLFQFNNSSRAADILASIASGDISGSAGVMPATVTDYLAANPGASVTEADNGISYVANGNNYHIFATVTTNAAPPGTVFIIQ
jgi:hypothetical protein